MAEQAKAKKQETTMDQIIQATEASAPMPALEAIERAHLDVAIVTAKRYPMHTGAAGIRRFQEEGIAMATVNEETARSCLYALPRGGKTIRGRSVRLAEIAASAYGNINFATRIIDVGEKEIVAQGACHDLERNVSATTEVRRRITNRGGQRYNDDMIAVTCNAAASIALRNAIFKVVPAALVEPIYEAAQNMAVGDASTLDIRRVKCVGAFALMGVTEERLLAKVQRPSVSEITGDDLVELIGLFNSIRAKEINVDEAFPLPVDERLGAEGVAARLGSRGKKEKKEKPAPKPASQMDLTDAAADAEAEKARAEFEEGKGE